MLKKISNIASTVLVVAAVLLAILLVGVRVVGLTPYTVISGSMEPQYPVGSIIYVAKVHPTELQVGDPVTYTLNGSTVVTHRIVEVLQDEHNPGVVSFRTKGDANRDVDGPVLDGNNVLGKPVFHIPYLGYLSNVIQKPQGLLTMVAICVLIFLIPYMLGLVKSLKEATATEATANTESLSPSADAETPESESNSNQ